LVHSPGFTALGHFGNLGFLAGLSLTLSQSSAWPSAAM
jgi:hypothetical protein